VVSNIVLQDIRRLTEAIREIERVLRPGGRFVFSITHPAFEAPVPGRWVKEPQDTERIEDRQYLAVDRYFDRLAVFWGVQGHPTVAGFHRPLRDYFEALHATGLLVARLEEPGAGGEALGRHYREFADLLRIPLFLVVEAIKPPSMAPDAGAEANPPESLIAERGNRPRSQEDWTDHGGRL
jgi:SAM-dependent methyltransferase